MNCRQVDRKEKRDDNADIQWDARNHSTVALSILGLADLADPGNWLLNEMIVFMRVAYEDVPYPSGCVFSRRVEKNLCGNSNMLQSHNISVVGGETGVIGSEICRKCFKNPFRPL